MINRKILNVGLCDAVLRTVFSMLIDYNTHIWAMNFHFVMLWILTPSILLGGYTYAFDLLQTVFSSEISVATYKDTKSHNSENIM